MVEFTNPTPADATEEMEAVVDSIKPLMAGRDPRIQGLVVAYLLAIWLAGHPAGERDTVLQLVLTAARDFVPIAVAEDLAERRR